VVKETAFRLVFRDVKRFEKGRSRCPDTQIGIENDEWFSQGGDDVLGKFQIVIALAGVGGFVRHVRPYQVIRTTSQKNDVGELRSMFTNVGLLDKELSGIAGRLLLSLPHSFRLSL